MTATSPALPPLLPVAVDLRDRLAVVVGGGPDAAERAHALVAAGAEVRVISPWICESLIDLVERGAADWLARDYAGVLDLDRAWFVHALSGDGSTDAAVAHDAAASRIWCSGGSPADRTSVAAHTSVTTPSGVVGLAAYGAASEATLGDVRGILGEALDAGRIDVRSKGIRQTHGWVALVGGGPGSDDLLTTRGQHLLRSADVVVVDRLAPRGVVDRLPATVQVIDVGKTPGHHPVPQDQINALLVEHATAGRGVVRLKGGDPYVLGRGGEERIVCEAAGIPVEVVPGVTSAISVPAAAGIPVTHREIARGFTVVTGHEDLPTVPPGSDHTLLILMGIGHLEAAVQTLLATGRSRDCPVAIIERGWTPEQRVTVGELADIAVIAARCSVRSPAVIVVGDVVRLGPDWQAAARR